MVELVEFPNKERVHNVLRLAVRAGFKAQKFN